MIDTLMAISFCPLRVLFQIEPGLYVCSPLQLCSSCPFPPWKDSLTEDSALLIPGHQPLAQHINTSFHRSINTSTEQWSSRQGVNHHQPERVLNTCPSLFSIECNTVAENPDSGARLSRLNIGSLWPLTTWLCLGFAVCKTRTLVIPNSSDCWED